MLINLQVSVGGQNIFISDFGISTGSTVIDQQYWEWSKWYFVNVERRNNADKLQQRNIKHFLNNNSIVPMDIMVFVFYSDKLVIDAEIGAATKHLICTMGCNRFQESVYWAIQ